MPLQETVESLEDVPEVLHDSYQKGDDGKYHLAGFVPKDRLDEFRNNNITLQKKLERYKGIDPSKVTPDALEELERLRQAEEERQRKEAEKKGEYDKLLAQVQEKANKQTEAEKARADALANQLNKTLRENAARAALEAEDAFVKVMLPHVLAQTEMREIDGQQVAVVVDANGDPKVADATGRLMTIQELVQEMKSQDEWAVGFKAPSAAGGGASGRSGAGGAGNKAFKDMTEREKIDWLEKLTDKHGADEAKRLYYEAVRTGKAA